MKWNINLHIIFEKNLLNHSVSNHHCLDRNIHWKCRETLLLHQFCFSNLLNHLTASTPKYTTKIANIISFDSSPGSQRSCPQKWINRRLIDPKGDPWNVNHLRDQPWQNPQQAELQTTPVITKQARNIMGRLTEDIKAYPPQKVFSRPLSQISPAVKQGHQVVRQHALMSSQHSPGPKVQSRGIGTP